ncbi:Zn(II)2Cys6 transcription factor [Aspergillus lucknowensis]|uniref:Zn(2)-C6 fungal-type domain-containing protein n=1 Tax=Aspergillus lucknowensis TaxID=176173 RepID=A0ABR4LS62_9EURO
MQHQGVGIAGRISKPGRRFRIPLSCESCRARKLKCNREKPCQNCIVRGEQTTCAYKSSTHGTPASCRQDKHVDPMRQRIDHLEDLVKGLIAQRQTPPDTISSQGLSELRSESASPSNLVLAGTTLIDGAHSVYKATDDWQDVLQEVNELKRLWDETQEASETQQPRLSNTVDGTSLLFGQVQRADLPDILSSLPPKPEVDRLIQWFFDRNKFPLSIPPILHEPTFMREYTKHWEDPSQTSIIWVGLLFSILGITMLALQFSTPPGFEGMSESQFHLYRLRTAQCLLMGDIAKCLPYTVETLRFNATAELNRKDDNSRGLWIMTGVIVRAAVNMGYHRDPSHMPSLSILEAEYRRRVWLSVANMDEVASFLAGFPRMVPAVNADTKEPHNLHDWELTEAPTTLPPSRPLSDTTPVTYLIAKSRLFRGLGSVVDLINSPRPGPYSSVLDVDEYLHKAYRNLPPEMRVDPRKTEPGSFRNQLEYSNLQLMCLYHHGLITLHRRNIPKDRNNAPGNISRSRCIHSALALIDYQRLLLPFWYTFSQTRQMLARAAMILLLELESRRRGPDTDNEISTDSLLDAFENSVALWNEAKDSCEEAHKVHQTLDSLLFGLKKPYSEAASFETVPPLDIDLFDLSNDQDVDWASWDEYFQGDWPEQ